MSIDVDLLILCVQTAAPGSQCAGQCTEGLLVHAWLLLLQVMREQETGGKIFFIDGTGAWGNPTPQNVAYGAAKRAITQVKVNAGPKSEYTNHQRIQ